MKQAALHRDLIDPKPHLPPLPDRLEIFATLLLRWTRKINLIAPGDQGDLRRRHIDDSLQLLPHMEKDVTHAIDLGSGGGFPGLVLAIASGVHFHLVESDQRKAAFLREAARLTEAPVTIHASRIESIEIPPAPLVTARALAPLPRLLPLAARSLAPQGMLLLLKGESVDAELTAVAEEWHMQVRRHQSATHPSASILQITGLRRVPHSSD